MVNKFPVTKLEANQLLNHKKHLESGLPILIVLTDKYDTFYDVCNSYKSFLNYFLKRLDNIFDSFLVKPEYPESPELSQEDIDRLPNGRIKKEALEDLEFYKNSRKEYEQDLKEYNTAKEALKNNDGEIAYFIIMRRGEYEYEKIQIERLNWYE